MKISPEPASTQGIARGSPVPIRPGAVIVCLYLAVTTPLIVAAGLGGTRWLVLLAHVGALAAVAAAELRRSAGTAGRWTTLFADLHVLVLIPGLYTELPLLMEGWPGAVVYKDEVIQRIEIAIFGTQPAWELAGALPITALSEVLHLAYLLYYPIIYMPPLVWYTAVVRNRGGGMPAGAEREGVPGRGGGMAGAATESFLTEAMLALTLSMILCYVVFIAWPVQGPRYLAAPAGVSDGPIRSLTLAIVETGSSRGAAFPSSHVSVAVTQTLLMLRYRRAFGAVLAVMTFLLAVGAVYVGFHYVTDTLAGLVVGVFAAWSARPLASAFAARSLGLPEPRSRLT